MGVERTYPESLKVCELHLPEELDCFCKTPVLVA